MSSVRLSVANFAERPFLLVAFGVPPRVRRRRFPSHGGVDAILNAAFVARLEVRRTTPPRRMIGGDADAAAAAGNPIDTLAIIGAASGADPHVETLVCRSTSIQSRVEGKPFGERLEGSQIDTGSGTEWEERINGMNK